MTPRDPGASESWRASTCWVQTALVRRLRPALMQLACRSQQGSCPNQTTLSAALSDHHPNLTSIVPTATRTQLAPTPSNPKPGLHCSLLTCPSNLSSLKPPLYSPPSGRIMSPKPLRLPAAYWPTYPAPLAATYSPVPAFAPAAYGPK